MNITVLASRYFDKYSIVARLFPAALLVIPIFVSTIAVFPNLLSGKWNMSAFGIFLISVLYLLASLGRSRGKILQEDLLAEWGGWPSTIMLRHQNQVVDPKTKARYHRALEKLLGEPLPSEADELANPISADHAYRAATKVLIEKRRGEKYPRVQEELASFGFRRNLLGLKNPALLVAALCIIATAAVWVAKMQSIGLPAALQVMADYPVFPCVIAANFVYAIALSWGVNRRFVRQAGNEYAFALYRSLEASTARTKVAA